MSFAGTFALHTLEDAIDSGDQLAAVERFRELYARYPGLRRTLGHHWSIHVQRLCHNNTRPPHVWEWLDAMLALRDQLFPDDAASQDTAALALDVCGRWTEVLEGFPGAFYSQIWSLFSLGRTREILEKHSYLTFVRDEALLRLGRVSEVPPNAELYPFALALQDRLEESLAVEPHWQVLLVAGQAQRVVSELGQQLSWGAVEAMALRRVGRAEEAMARGDVVSLLYGGRIEEATKLASTLDHWRTVWSYRSLLAFASGQRSDYDHARSERSRIPYSWRAANAWFGEVFMLPFLDWLDGDRQAISRAWEKVAPLAGEVQALNMKYFGQLVTGEIDEPTFDSQPVKLLLPARRAVALALRAELTGQPASALAHYRQFLALPVERRLFDMDGDDPVLDEFVAWRARTLAAPGGAAD